MDESVLMDTPLPSFLGMSWDKFVFPRLALQSFLHAVFGKIASVGVPNLCEAFVSWF